jgi:hypothetical protein
MGVLKAQGSWSWELKPLLDEYVFALRAAEATRDGFAWLDALERYADSGAEMPDIAWKVLGEIAGSLPTQWDRHAKRAATLADQLALTPRGRKAVGLGFSDDQQASDPLSELDEIAVKRAVRA